MGRDALLSLSPQPPAQLRIAPQENQTLRYVHRLVSRREKSRDTFDHLLSGSAMIGRHDRQSTGHGLQAGVGATRRLGNHHEHIALRKESRHIPNVAVPSDRQPATQFPKLPGMVLLVSVDPARKMQPAAAGQFLESDSKGAQ